MGTGLLQRRPLRRQEAARGRADDPRETRVRPPSLRTLPHHRRSEDGQVDHADPGRVESSSLG